MKRTFPKKDIDLTNSNEISERIKSIEKQVDRLELVESRTINSFDSKHNKITKLNERKDALWRKRAIIIRAERHV